MRHFAIAIAWTLLAATVPGGFVRAASVPASQPHPLVQAAVKLQIKCSGRASNFGSAVAINYENDRLYLLTNAHNFRDVPVGRDGSVRGTAYLPAHPTVSIDRVEFIGNLDAGEDLAVCSGATSRPPPIVSVLQRDLRIGDRANLLGYPGGGAMSIRSARIVSQSSRVGQQYVDEFDTGVEQGMSGGPVYVDGQLAGLIFATETKRPRSLAMPLRPIRRVLARLFPRLAERRRDALLAQCGPRGCPVPQPSARPDFRPMPTPSLPSRTPQGIAGPLLPSNTKPAPVAPTRPDMSQYVTKDDLKAYVRRDDLNSLATVSQLSAIDNRISVYQKQLETNLADVARRSDLTPYARTDSVNRVVNSSQDSLLKRMETRIDQVVGGAAERFSWVEALRSVAEYFGLSVAVPGGVLGLVAVNMLKIWLRRKPAGGPADPFEQTAEHRTPTLPHASSMQYTPNVAQPVPAPIVKREHEIVRVPTTDKTADAINEALNREARTFPKHAPMVERVRSVAKQILHGDDVTEAGRAVPTTGIGWRDAI